jgi:hypothetical protein
MPCLRHEEGAVTLLIQANYASEHAPQRAAGPVHERVVWPGCHQHRVVNAFQDPARPTPQVRRVPSGRPTGNPPIF